MDDEKIAELYQKFDYLGTGLFHAILEKIAKQEKPIKTSVLKKQLNVGKKLEKVWCFMEEIGLISSNNGETFNKQLLNFSESYKIKNKKNAERVSEWRKNQADKENVTSTLQPCNTPKVKESKVNKIFNKPTIDEIKEYCTERKNSVDSERFFNHYESNGWMVGKTKMKDWRAAIRNWEKNSFDTATKQPEKKWA